MKPIEELLKNLGRPEVLEFGLVTNRLPSVNIGGKFEPVDDEAPSTEALLQMLVTMGGSRYVDALTDKPVQWTTRLDGIGVIAVAAIMRKDIVQARFTVARRDAPANRAEPYQSTTQAGVPGQRKDATPAQMNRPAGQFSRTVAGPGPAPAPKVETKPLPAAGGAPIPAPAPSPQPAPKPAQAPAVAPAPAPAVIQAKKPASVPPPATTKGVGPSAPSDEWDDDDEPTVQTLSPPVAPPGASPAAGTPAVAPATASMPPGDPRPKPARKPDEPQPSIQPRTERVAPREPAESDRQVLAAKSASMPAAPLRIPSSPAVSQPVPSPIAATKPEARRINTPTSVDAVDVEITTTDKSARPIAVHADADGNENTVEFTPPPKPKEAKADSAVPSTSPSAAGPEKERLRGDATLEAYFGLAAAEKASDLHILSERPVLLRVATDLVPRTQPVPAASVERMVREVVPSRLRPTLESEGSVDFALEHPQHGRFRVNVSRQRTGYKLSMRVIPRGVPTLAALGLPEAVGQAASFHQGLVLVTGPTGHGKTTTLAAIVDLINTESKHHVLTVEDPVEIVHARKKALMSQREVGTHAKTFAAALKASLREDPDVIVVGELRDAETVRMAVAASETGHLVIGTMNTPNAAKTIDRLIDLFPPAEQQQVRTSVAGALRLIIGQRLVPSADRRTVYPAVELLPSSIALYTLIRDNRTFQIPSLQQRGRAMGVVRLDESLADLVRAGKVTLEVAKQFAEAPAELEAQARAVRK